MDDQEFKTRADVALDSLYKRLSKGKFVVSPNAPVRQIWVSAHSKSFKLNWDDAREAFVLRETGQNLEEMIAGAIGKHLGEEVTL